MTKAKYMEQLQKNLDRFSKELQEEILEDYRQHFAEGEKQGKSDEEIIQELGNIEEMIQGLSEVDVEKTDDPSVSESAEKESYQYSGDYGAVELECDMADIELEPSEDGQISVDYDIQGNEKFCRHLSFYQREEDGVLYAGIKGSNWKGKDIFESIRINGNIIGFGRGKGSAVLKVKVPEKMQRLAFYTGSGDIRAHGLSVGTLSGHTGSGDLSAQSLSADELGIQTGSGDLYIQDAEAKKIEISATSGDVKAARLMAGMLKLTTTSGDLEAANVKAEEMVLSAASGDVELEEAKVASGQITAASGDIDIQRIHAVDLSVETASGDIAIQAEVENCRCQTANGDIDLNFTGQTKRVNMNTVHGNVCLNLNGVEGMEANVSAKLGDIHISWAGEHRSVGQGLYRYGDGSCKINASTSYGDLEIDGR